MYGSIGGLLIKILRLLKKLVAISFYDSNWQIYAVGLIMSSFIYWHKGIF